MAFLTVFTPAYNRAHTLGRTYDSLKSQSCKDFIWLIVDDGSTDNTRVLVSGWIEEKPGFEIEYIYKPNGGMHTAHNTAYENIRTELNICIDSDDILAMEAVSIIRDEWARVREDDLAGLIGLDASFDGTIIGTGFPDGLKRTTLSGYYASGGSGDKKLVYRTDIIRRYPPYPVFENEKYVALAYKYRLVDQDYQLAVVNKVLCNVEYQADGSSNTMYLQYLRNPKGFTFWRRVCLKYPQSTKRMIVDCAHYVADGLLAGEKHLISSSPRKMLTAIVYPLGFLFSLYIRYRGRA